MNICAGTAPTPCRGDQKNLLPKADYLNWFILVPRDTCIQRHGNTRQILTCFLLFPTENYWAPSPRYTCGRVERTLESEDLGPPPRLAPSSQAGPPGEFTSLSKPVSSPTCLVGKITPGDVWNLNLKKYTILQNRGETYLLTPLDFSHFVLFP